MERIDEKGTAAAPESGEIAIDTEAKKDLVIAALAKQCEKVDSAAEAAAARADMVAATRRSAEAHNAVCEMMTKLGVPETADWGFSQDHKTLRWRMKEA